MNETYWIHDVQPQPWEAPPFTCQKRGRRFIPVAGRSEQLHVFKEDLGREFRRTYPDVTPTDDQIALVFRFWRNTSAGEEQADWTNLTKGAEDALQGHLYTNDRNVVDGRGIIMDQSPTAPNLIAVTISTPPPMHDIEIPERPKRPGPAVDTNKSLVDLSQFFQPTTN